MIAEAPAVRRQDWVALLVALACLGASPFALAYHLPKWEAGFGLGYLTVPPYRGVDASNSYWIPFPYVRYRGDTIRVDDDGIRAGLFKSESIKLDFSIAANVPVRNDANGLRVNMPTLDPVLEIGPTFDWRLARDVESASSVWLRMPWRPVMSVGNPWLAFRGWVFAPYLEFNRAVRGSSLWRFSASVGPMFGSAGYHDYFYEVNAAETTPQRAEYHPSGGYSGSRVTFSLVQNRARMWAGAFARYDDLRGAVFAGSPLVQTKRYLVFGVTAAWVLVHSDATTPH